MGKFCFNCGKSLKSGAVFCSNCGTKIIRSSTAPSDNIADRLAPAAGVLAGAAVVAVEESAQAQTTNVANAAAAAPAVAAPGELTGEVVKNAIDIGTNVFSDAADNAEDAVDTAKEVAGTLFDIFFG